MASSKKVKVTFLPEGSEIEVPMGYNLRQAILDAGLNVDSSCGGVGTCGRCMVKVDQGSYHAKKSRFITKEDSKAGYCLSCTTEIKSDLVVTLPEEKIVKAKIEHGKMAKRFGKVYSGISMEEQSSVEIAPWIKKGSLRVEKPSLSYGTSDLFRLVKAIKEKMDIDDCIVPIELIRKLPAVLRQKDWHVTVVVDTNINTLVDILPGRIEQDIYGIALDIGTTSLVMYLVDLESGHIIETASKYNPQIKFGEDIINRIVYSDKKDGLKNLKDVLIKDLNKLILSLFSSTEVEGDSVVSLMVSGNPTMMHLFYGVPPKYIREEPYVTVANKFSNSRAKALGLEHIKNALAYSIPGVASYLGGDITSGVLATDLAVSDELSLFIDLGTNGELVVGNSEWMMGCSCSAGPAFEGGGVKCGIRAVEGAIEKVSIDQDTFDCKVEVIGDCPPTGICGSGLIDIIGEMYLKGVIDRKGKFNKELGIKKLKEIDDSWVYILVDKKESGNKKDIYISEIDIDNLMRAKAAVYSGITTLLEEVGLNVGDLEKIYIAGGLGKNINIRNAIVIGMLPDIDERKYYFMGNTSITGAYLSLLSKNKFDETWDIAQKITYVELSVNMKFMDRYVAGLFLPYTDLRDFPSVEQLLFDISKKAKRKK